MCKTFPLLFLHSGNAGYLMITQAMNLVFPVGIAPPFLLQSCPLLPASPFHLLTIWLSNKASLMNKPGSPGSRRLACKRGSRGGVRTLSPTMYEAQPRQVLSEPQLPHLLNGNQVRPQFSSMYGTAKGTS